MKFPHRSDDPGFSGSPSPEEQRTRKRLGIPPDARLVIVFGESSHWDPNWLLTSEEYYRLRIGRILDQVIEALEAEPRRVFSVECIFFLKMYWERNPQNQETIRRLVNAGRIRLTGSGMTTPDTLLPETEALMRDYLLGQEWLRRNGMSQEPRLAYLPDDFGHSPTLPDLLDALGVEMAAVSRIDGSFFPGSDYCSSSRFPRPGSSAETLSRVWKTSDFIWKGVGGSRVLCHWNPFTYGQGDMIASRGAIRWMGLTLGVPDRSIKNVSAKIDTYVEKLLPLARTPYLFCPMGMDFNGPIRDLVGLLDGYNGRVYPDSGVFAVNAGMDDYLDLVSCRRELLPELALDMNPYWMGFYASRPEMKQRCKGIVRDLVRIEKQLALAGDAEGSRALFQALEPAWETAVVANHHDFITGTSPDRVWKKDQKPWLLTARKIIDEVKERAPEIAPSSTPATSVPRTLVWDLNGGILQVETGLYRIEITESGGGCISEWVDPTTGMNLLAGPANDTTAYLDSGGLWRMGHEYRGGSFRLCSRSSQQAAAIRVDERKGVLHVFIESELEGRKLSREMWFRADSPFLRMRLTGSARKRRTVTCRFPAALRPGEISMEVPGGVADRPLVKLYDPTFWPALGFAHLRDHKTGNGIALFMGGPASVSANERGVMECVALRNTPMERAFGVLPLPAHPAYGKDGGEHAFDYAVGFTRQGDWRTNRLHVLAPEVLAESWIEGGQDDCSAGISTESEDIRILAVKPAHRGDGLIVRLQSFGPVGTSLAFEAGPIHRAVLCDARERDREELRCTDGKADIPFKGSIVTVRVTLQGLP